MFVTHSGDRVGVEPTGNTLTSSTELRLVLIEPLSLVLTRRDALKLIEELTRGLLLLDELDRNGVTLGWAPVGHE